MNRRAFTNKLAVSLLLVVLALNSLGLLNIHDVQSATKAHSPLATTFQSADGDQGGG